MKSVLLDTNIYDKLALDGTVRSRVVDLIDRGDLCLIATPMVVDELAASPIGGLPDWFSIIVKPESVAVVGFWHIGEARLGEGEVYAQHRGSSNKVPDGIIANSADALADIFVSEDSRSRTRLAKISTRCASMSYSGFCRWLDRC